MDVAAHNFMATGTQQSSLLEAGSSTKEQSHQVMLSVPLLVLAAVAWFIEQRRRTDSPAGQAGSVLPGFAHFGRAILRLLPELAGLGFCAIVICAVLLRGENNGSPVTTQEDDKLWKEIQTEWPMLTTADTLLALAAVLRVALLASALLRSQEADSSPLMGMPVLLFLLAAAARVALLALSPQDVYHLDGPLGGTVNVVFEVLGLALLTCLGWRACRQGLGKGRMLVLAAIVVIVMPVAICNRMSLADPSDTYLDVLFSLSHLFELFAAAAFLARTVSAASHPAGPSAALAYLVLPLQQLLPVCFLLTAWGSQPFQAVPELVGAGCPFELLQIGGVMQVAMYLLSWALRLAFSLEEQKDPEVYMEI